MSIRRKHPVGTKYGVWKGKLIPKGEFYYRANSYVVYQKERETIYAKDEEGIARPVGSRLLVKNTKGEIIGSIEE